MLTKVGFIPLGALRPPQGGARRAARYAGLLALAYLLCTAPVSTAQPHLGLMTVVIDPGHGGIDPGTHGRKSQEKDIVLNVGLKFGELIKRQFPDVNVIYTRKADTFIELNQRSAIANAAHADLFISIHCNSAAASAALGVETYVMGLHKTESNLEVAQRENSVIVYESDYSSKYEGYDPNSPESFIIFSLMQNLFLEQSLQFATLVQEAMSSHYSRHNRGVKQAGFLVLYKSSMPAVLVELGFLSNRKEEQFLISKDGQEKLARGLLAAFTQYKCAVDAKAGLVAKPNPEPPQSTLETHTPTPAAQNQASYFYIQVASVPRPIEKNHPLRKEFHQLIEHHTGHYYRYYTQRFTSLEEAKKNLKSVREKHQDAFIVQLHTAL